MQKDCKIVLFEVGGLANEQYSHITRQLALIQRKMSQLDDRLVAMDARINEATTEILALLEQLRNESLSDTGRAALEDAETKVNALADIVPNPEAKA